jgi:hypothetical protein
MSVPKTTKKIQGPDAGKVKKGFSNMKIICFVIYFVKGKKLISFTEFWEKK